MQFIFYELRQNTRYLLRHSAYYVNIQNNNDMQELKVHIPGTVLLQIQCITVDKLVVLIYN